LAGDCRWCGRIPGTNVGRAELPLFINDAQELTITKSGPTPDPVGLAEITFATNSVQLLAQYIAENGIKTVKSSSESGIAVDDPDGHHLRFVETYRGHWNYTHKVRGMRLIHAGFVVHDRAAEEHFYKDILGFRPYWHGGMKDGQDDWVSLQVPNGTDWLEFMVNVSPGASHRTLGVMNHVAIGVRDIHETQKFLIGNGMKLTEEPKIGRDGKWQLNLYDPDDTRVEFMEFTPVQKPCCSEYTGPHPKP
jgi:catechol 2,3-dioxygenase-like lactoylglutathione lyase family enzyme